jgi:hypothetical protein
LNCTGQTALLFGHHNLGLLQPPTFVHADKPPSIAFVNRQSCELTASD